MNYHQCSKWFDIWVMSNLRDLRIMGDISFICECCPHRNDEHSMNCIECCPVRRAVNLMKGNEWEKQYFLSRLRVSA